MLLFASGRDNVANDLPLSPAFVAFVGSDGASILPGEERVRGAGSANCVCAPVQSGEWSRGRRLVLSHATVDYYGAGWEAATAVAEGSGCGPVSSNWSSAFYQAYGLRMGGDALIGGESRC